MSNVLWNTKIPRYLCSIIMRLCRLGLHIDYVVIFSIFWSCRTPLQVWFEFSMMKFSFCSGSFCKFLLLCCCPAKRPSHLFLLLHLSTLPLSTIFNLFSSSHHRYHPHSLLHRLDWINLQANYNSVMSVPIQLKLQEKSWPSVGPLPKIPNHWPKAWMIHFD